MREAVPGKMAFTGAGASRPGTCSAPALAVVSGGISGQNVSPSQTGESGDDAAVQRRRCAQGTRKQRVPKQHEMWRRHGGKRTVSISRFLFLLKQIRRHDELKNLEQSLRTETGPSCRFMKYRIHKILLVCCSEDVFEEDGHIESRSIRSTST